MIVKDDLEISHVNDVNNLLDRKKFYFLKKIQGILLLSRTIEDSMII